MFTLPKTTVRLKWSLKQTRHNPHWLNLVCVTPLNYPALVLGDASPEWAFPRFLAKSRFVKTNSSGRLLGVLLLQPTSRSSAHEAVWVAGADLIKAQGVLPKRLGNGARYTSVNRPFHRQADFTLGKRAFMSLRCPSILQNVSRIK